MILIHWMEGRWWSAVLLVIVMLMKTVIALEILIRRRAWFEMSVKTKTQSLLNSDVKCCKILSGESSPMSFQKIRIIQICSGRKVLKHFKFWLRWLKTIFIKSVIFSFWGSDTGFLTLWISWRICAYLRIVWILLIRLLLSIHMVRVAFMVLRAKRAIFWVQLAIPPQEVAGSGVVMVAL